MSAGIHFFYAALKELRIYQLLYLTVPVNNTEHSLTLTANTSSGRAYSHKCAHMWTHTYTTKCIF